MSRKKKAARRPSRSKFEQGLMDRLDREGIEFGYETETFKIVVEVPGSRCVQCGTKNAVVRDTRYTPDFFFNRPKLTGDAGWIIEAKGKFTARDRKRVLALLATMQTTGETRGFAMLFMRDNKLSKSSKTRYSDWCGKHGIPYAIGWFDREWLR